ncbi:hypothetical protein CORC01_11037 [Colletotrichum orchidophilum]|uniref:Uncharacterized protein n=1 Tax=Colletotrichum orchidophilum TaxID=1209926 RepID=A0A1G4AWW9_9PEZI|nr:uncharacterized protein CORC01_11037 [Colletotrichum orchidophilum]OHE93634.1 hypothetical protein CORC01_11037 [Colletotrichum orchidophilum]
MGDKVTASHHKPQPSRCSISILSYCMSGRDGKTTRRGSMAFPAIGMYSCVSYLTKLADRQLQLHRVLTANVNSLAANIRRSLCSMVASSASFKLPLAERRHRSTFCWGSAAGPPLMAGCSNLKGPCLQPDKVTREHLKRQQKQAQQRPPHTSDKLCRQTTWKLVLM